MKKLILLLVCVFSIPDCIAGEGKEKEPLVVLIDPYYNYGKIPDLKLSEDDSTLLREIIRKSKDKPTKKIPSGSTVLAPGICGVEFDNKLWYITKELSILYKDLSIKEKKTIYAILSKYTKYFTKP